MFRKGSGIVCHEIGAGSRTSIPLPIHGSGPVAAKRHVENDLMAVEMGCNIRISSREIIVGFAPVGCGRLPREDIRGNARSRELPYSDSIAAPVHGVDSSARVVESVAVAGAQTTISSTSSVGGLSGCADIAVQGVEFSGLLVQCDYRVGGRM